MKNYFLLIDGEVVDYFDDEDEAIEAFEECKSALILQLIGEGEITELYDREDDRLDIFTRGLNYPISYPSLRHQMKIELRNL